MPYLLVAIVAVFALLRLFEPRIKGYLGERAIRRIFVRLPKAEYFALHDVLLQSEKNTVQIDHILVSKYGIFVIETKNYQGWIFGDEYSKQWTQSIYRHKSRFMNPIHQNYGHIQALQKLLALGNDDFISIIAFSRRCKLKLKHKIDNVIYFDQLTGIITQHSFERFPSKKTQEILQKIADNNIVDHSERRRHIRNVRHKNA